MMITGRLWKDGTWWLAESEIADVCTQGRSRKDAARMLADAFETLIEMFDELLRAVSSETTLIIGSRRLGTKRAPSPVKRRKRRAA